MVYLIAFSPLFSLLNFSPGLVNNVDNANNVNNIDKVYKVDNVNNDDNVNTLTLPN